MSGLTSRLIDLLCHTLNPEEREAVCGDLAESGAPQRAILYELTGLVVRRQLLAWRDWRPWLALAGIAAPVGLLLSLMSRWQAQASGVYAWFYVNNWTWEYLQSPGARHDLLQYGGTFIVSCLAMLCWAWTAGYAIRVLSGRTFWLTGALFVAMLFGTALSSAPSATDPSSVISHLEYGVLFPLAIRVLVVLLPATAGMRRAGHRPISSRSALLWTVAVCGLTFAIAGPLARAVTNGWPAVSLRFASIAVLGHGQHVLHLTIWPWPWHFLPLLVAWPVFYIVIRTIRSQPADGDSFAPPITGEQS